MRKLSTQSYRGHCRLVLKLVIITEKKERFSIKIYERMKNEKEKERMKKYGKKKES